MSDWSKKWDGRNKHEKNLDNKFLLTLAAGLIMGYWLGVVSFYLALAR